jgi:flagellar motility protein MotE (MotC chaperone)
MKTLRLFPALMLAGGCLLLLKVADIAFVGPTPAMAQSATPQTTDAAQSPKEQTAQAQTNQPADIPNLDRLKDDVPGLPEGTMTPDGRPYVTTGISNNSGSNVTSDLSPAERALLERLGERREELDEREELLRTKESLLEAAEKRIAARIKELEALEASLVGLNEQKETARLEQVQGLVTMYESMKPKDAARIFDRLQMDVLLSVVEQMKPRVMSSILAQMEPENAERLTIAIARKNAAKAAEAEAQISSGRELQRIGG